MADNAIDIDVNDMKDHVETVEPTTTEDSSPKEIKQAVDPFDKGFDGEDAQEEVKPEEPKEEVKPQEEPKEADQPVAEEQPPSKADERKHQLNTEIRDLVAQRNAIKEEVEKLNSQVYQPATEQELQDQINPETGEYFNRVEAKLAAMEQRQELERYNQQVADAQLTLSHEATKALNDFPEFDPMNKDKYDPDMAARADRLLGQALVFDEKTGQVIGAKISPYEIYQSIAEPARAYAAKGEINGQKAQEEMLAASDSIGGEAPKVEKKDDFLKGFESV